MERCWKILSTNLTNLVAEVEFTYPADRVWTEHLNPKSLALCERGYHYAEGRHVLDWLPERNTALLCEIEPCPQHEPKRGDNKTVTCTLRIIGTYRLTASILGRFACDCAQRALERERAAGREPDPRSWEAVGVARRYAYGKATQAELEAAWAAASAAKDAAASAAWAAASAARAAAWAAWAAASAARDAARDAEKDWQYHRLLQLAGAEQ